MLNRAAIILTPLLLLGAFLEQRTFLTPGDAAPYHAAAREAMRTIPYVAGDWDGVDVGLPEPAQKLLRPNAVIAREYRKRPSGPAATLILVQCGDTRDLAGHYPPVCYPGQGWRAGGHSDRSVALAGGEVRVRRYTFSRASFDRETWLVVYSFFVIPGRGLVPDMESVYSAAADHQARALGAAQVQVVLEDAASDEQERRVVSEILDLAAGAIGVIQRGHAGSVP